jgi:hypothetical protein
MTEANLTNFDNQSQAVSTPDVSTQVQTPAVEKMVPQSVVDNAIKHEKHRVDERIAQARREAVEEYQRQHGMSQGHVTQPAQTQHMGVPQANVPDPEAVVNNVLAKRDAEYKKQQQDAYGQKVLSEFHQELEAGKQKYPDFEKVVAPLVNDAYAKPETYGNLIHMVMTEFKGHAKDILHEMGSDKGKLAKLIVLSRESPGVARAGLMEMAESIKVNQEAQKIKTGNEPLSQIKPSNIGKGDDSASISAIRRKAAYRV